MFTLQIAYSWGDKEEKLEFDTRLETWETAKRMAMAEADTASEESVRPVSMIVDKSKLEIILTYPNDRSECRYTVL